MSDTDNQENLSVEDILSSIKNILVDEEEKEQKKEEDVLNLDNSMIVDNSVSSENIENLLDSMTEPVAEEKTDSEETTDSDGTTSLADSIDVEKTLDIADKIDLNAIPALDNLINDEPDESGVKQETIDASANIINNFAKVFAEKQHSLQTQTAPSSAELDASITAQIKQNIDSHFEELATKIITEQTQQWLNENLASIVEQTVAKEIERVIAKVGS